MSAVVDFDPSIVSRMPADEYFAMPGISISRLKTLARSALHYQWELRHPKSSSAMTLGHCCTLRRARAASVRLALRCVDAPVG
jgi:hypothetical protein